MAERIEQVLLLLLFFFLKTKKLFVLGVCCW